MSKEYSCDPEELLAIAKRPSLSAAARGLSMGLSEELRALYRMGGALTPEEVEDMIRHVLKKRKMSDEEIERELANLRAELPRIRNSQRDGLFAADVKPRFLSKRRICGMAYRLLAEHGFDENTYEPPTRIEFLADNIEGVTYEIRELPSKNGEAIVLGLTKGDGALGRHVIVNSVLADSSSQTDLWRFNFTLAHELFHAIEHLSMVVAPLSANLMRYGSPEPSYVERQPLMHKKSRAEKAVNAWAKSSRAHQLLTNEDWREWQANTFAAALLMPEWAIQKEFDDRFGGANVTVADEDNIRKVALEIAGTNEFGGQFYDESLSERFAVSRQSMAIRLLDLGLIREVTA